MYCFFGSVAFTVDASACLRVELPVNGAGPLTRNGTLLYETFSIRFIARLAVSAVKSGYYAQWIIKERNVTSSVTSSAHAGCRAHCPHYCYHGYKYQAESCASSCECRPDTGLTGICSRLQ